MCLARRPHIVQHSAYPGRYASNHSGRMTDIPLCLHKRVELGKIATHLRYHDIKMSTRCVSNDKKTIYKNIICRNCHVTPNVDSEKNKKRCLNFVNPIIHSPVSIGLQSFLVFVCSSMGSYSNASLQFILFGLRKSGGGRMTSTGRFGACYSIWHTYMCHHTCML